MTGHLARTYHAIRSVVARLIPPLVRPVLAAQVWHEPRVTIIATREDSGLTFGSDLTGKSAAS